jgi:penicillin-binding protein 1A
MDYTGAILSVVGGLGDKKEYGSLCLNRAVQSKRDMGSTINPVTSYGAAIYYDQAYFSEIVKDAKITLPSGKLWPPNYGGSVSNADYNLFYCLQRSLNTIPAQLVQKLGTQTVYDYATQRMGLDLALEDNDYSPLSIGSLTYGITLENLVNAYMPYGNAGMYYEAHIIDEVVESDGALLISNGGKNAIQAIDADSAWVVNRLMNLVVNGKNGTGANASLSKKNVIGKTGTSDNINDLSFIALTPDFVSGFWMGYDQKHGMSSKISSATIWKKIIGEFANEYDTGRQWPKNDNVISAKYCTVTGKIAGQDCPQSEIVGYYKQSNAPRCDGIHEEEYYEEVW